MEGKYNGKKYFTDDYTLCAHWDLNAKGTYLNGEYEDGTPHEKPWTGCPGLSIVNGYLKGGVTGFKHPHWGGGRALVSGKYECGVGKGSKAGQVRIHDRHTILST